MTTFHDRRNGSHSNLPDDYDAQDFFSSAKCDNCGATGMVVGVGSKDLCPDCANKTRGSRISDDEKADRKTLGYED